MRSGKDKASQLDMSIPFRLTGVPNNAVLELVRLPAGACVRPVSTHRRRVCVREYVCVSACVRAAVATRRRV